MPAGHTVSDMGADCARFIEDHVGAPVDLLLGESYGGMIAQHLAAEHPEVARRVVLLVAASTVTAEGTDIDVRWARARAEGRDAEAGAVFLEYLLRGPRAAPVRRLLGPLAGRLFSGSQVPSRDLLVEADAEAEFDARPVLPRIGVPVLLLCGDRDRFFSRESVLETCAAIPDCTLVWYRGKGHMRAASSRRVPQDVLAWVRRLDAARG
jgi:pimeloyl-ACP methyl ester carboxylesterase